MPSTRNRYRSGRPLACRSTFMGPWHRLWRRYKHFIRFLLPKPRKNSDADFFRVQKWTNRPKCDIVDTNPHASCAPGTIGTHNTAFLLYGSGLKKEKGVGMHKEANGRNFSSFWLWCLLDQGWYDDLVDGLANLTC